MHPMRLFVPLQKVDVEKREVWGRATQEVADRSGEIFDYASSKPYFETWSGDIAKATDGKSLGNVRAMHGKVAAGKLTAIDFNDTDLAIDVCAKIVDNDEWLKVTEGVYTGFSIGGSYEKRWKDGELTRFTANPVELSIVDLPCVPTATFAMVKAGGITEQVAFQKGMYDIARLAALLDEVKWLALGSAAEAQMEGDGSSVPGDLAAWLQMGLDVLPKMVAEEVAEAAEDVAEIVADAVVIVEAAASGDLAKVAEPVAAVEADDVAKAGARNSLADLEKLQAIHDHAAGLGASCEGAGKAATSDDLAKAANDLAKATLERDDALAKVAAQDAELAKRAARIAELEALPLPPKGAASTHAVSKTADSALGEPDALEAAIAKATGAEKALLMIKQAQRAPKLLSALR